MSARETIKEAYERLHRMETDEIVDYAYNLEQENKELKELCDKYEEEHGTTFKIWLKTIDKLKKIEKYIEVSKEQITTKYSNEIPKEILLTHINIILNKIKGDD